MENRFSTVERVAQSFPGLFSDPRENTRANCAAFTWAVCDALAHEHPAEQWGLLTKDSGENGYTWLNGLRTSVDNICIPNGERVDIIGSAGDPEKLASISWNVIPPDKWRPNNVWIAHTAAHAGGGSAPIPPPSEDALTKAFRQIDENNRFLRQVAGIWNLPFPGA